MREPNIANASNLYHKVISILKTIKKSTASRTQAAWVHIPTQTLHDHMTLSIYSTSLCLRVLSSEMRLLFILDEVYTLIGTKIVHKNDQANLSQGTCLRAM